MNWFIVLVATVLSAILYRLGGQGKEGNWLDILRNTKTRDWGCPLVCLIVVLLFGIKASWWIHTIAFVGMWMGLTTYWDKIFGYDNFYFHGIGVALPYLIYGVVVGVNPFGLMIRIAVVALFMGIWCREFSNADIEEYGRGAIIATSLALLLI